METNQLPSVFNYMNFRTYLSDYYDARHGQDRKFSKAAFCKEIGLAHTRGYINEVISKERPVTATFVERIIAAVRFNKEEAHYFRVLVAFCQAVNADEREMHFIHLVSLNHSPRRVLDENMLSYYREWHHNVIRAVLDVQDFDGNYVCLARKITPPISLKKARESIKLLSKLGLIKKNCRGFWKPTDKSISAPLSIQNELLIQYQLSLLEFAKQSLLTNRSQAQNITTNTISISEEAFKTIRERLENFRAEVRTIVSKDSKPASKVYQLNVQLFPAMSES